MKWLERIKESENINRLPLVEELREIAGEEEQDDIYDNWEGDITISDGTVIRLEKPLDCFNDKEHWEFYVIDDLYICAVCGQMQKSYEDIKEEVGYCDDFSVKLLPRDWDINGVRAYLKKGAIMQKQEEERTYYKPRHIFEGDCTTCIHMIKNECVFCNEEYQDECDDYEER